MQGLSLNIKICSILAFVIGLTMAILNLYESWSQHAGTVYDPMLYVTLFLIAMAFIMASFEHVNKYRVVMKLFIMEVRVEHLLRLTAYLFGGVIVFSVNSDSSVISTLHLFFTGFAIASGYLLMLTYPKTKTGYMWAVIGAVFGGCGFLLAYLFHTYSVAWGEVLAAFPLAIWIYKTLEK